MEMVTHALNWFEIPAADFNRAKEFYETIFDFEMSINDMGGTKMGFLSFDFQSGGIGGAICNGEHRTPSQEGSLIYLNGGEDLSVVLDKVESAGGQITMPKTHISPEIGFMALIVDTEGNKVGLHSRN